MHVTPVRFCSLVMGWCIKQFRHGGEEAQMQLEQWLYELDLPLPGEQGKPDARDNDLAADGESFLALMNSQAG